MAKKRDEQKSGEVHPEERQSPAPGEDQPEAPVQAGG